jgi:GNAT superfamily N-acetyltransferase
VTQTFGLGLFQTIETTHLDNLEGFFREREAPVFHEVGPLAGISVLRLLNERGYQPVELTSVMYRAIQTGVAPVPPCDDTIRVCQVGESDQERWARIAAEALSESGELSDFLLDLGKINPHRRDTISFLAEMNGQAIAAAALSINLGVAMLAGACTIPAWRRRGAQAALLYSRLKYAAESGCDIAMMCAGPGTSSQRNAERQGFRIAYTRLKWRLA